MSRIKEFRASFDKKLDALEHQALALEAQLTQTKDHAMQRLEQRKQQLRDLLNQVQSTYRSRKRWQRRRSWRYRPSSNIFKYN